MKTEAIAEALGGRKVLGKAIKKSDDLAQLIGKGLPARTVTALAERLDVSVPSSPQRLVFRSAR